MKFFYKNKSAPDGLHGYCRECAKAYMRRYNACPERQEAVRQYNTAPERLEAQKRYKKKWRSEHKELVSERSKVYKENNKKKVAASKKIYRAIRDGKITRPATCSKADSTCRGDIQAHHPDYDKPFGVIWLCTSHHQREHLDDAK